MTQKEVLNFKPAPRLEEIGDKCSKQVHDRKHRIGGCADSVSPCESRRIEFSGMTGIDRYPRVDVFTASEERLLDLAIAFSGLP